MKYIRRCIVECKQNLLQINNENEERLERNELDKLIIVSNNEVYSRAWGFNFNFY